MHFISEKFYLLEKEVFSIVKEILEIIFKN